MKKVMTFFLCVILGLCLAACVSDKETEESSLEDISSSSISSNSSNSATSTPPQLSSASSQSSSVSSQSSGEMVDDMRDPDLNDEPKEPTNSGGTVTHDSSIPVPDANAPLGSPENPMVDDMTDPDLK